MSLTPSIRAVAFYVALALFGVWAFGFNVVRFAFSCSTAAFVAEVAAWFRGEAPRAELTQARERRTLTIA